MFDERTYIGHKQPQWKTLAGILMRGKQLGLRNLPTIDLQRLGSVYRMTSADLAYLRTKRATPELINYLNDLVGDAHGLLYVDENGTNGFKQVIHFFTTDLADVLRRRMGYIGVAFFITIVGALLAYVMVHTNPKSLDYFIPPEFQSSADAWKKGFADHGDISPEQGALFSSALMVHNIQVGLGAFGTGITTILPAYMMFDNGAILGALVADVEPTGHLSSLWAGILPHGIFELSAIFIAGGAGFLVGWSLICPGQYSRKDALVANGKDAVKMMVATIPLLIVAGIIEGNVSHASIPHLWKFTLAALEFSALASYIYLRPALDATKANSPVQLLLRD